MQIYGKEENHDPSFTDIAGLFCEKICSGLLLNFLKGGILEDIRSYINFSPYGYSAMHGCGQRGQKCQYS
jgi:hypothetical protein